MRQKEKTVRPDVKKLVERVFLKTGDAEEALKLAFNEYESLNGIPPGTLSRPRALSGEMNIREDRLRFFNPGADLKEVRKKMIIDHIASMLSERVGWWEKARKKERN